MIKRGENESLLNYFNRITRNRKELNLSYEQWQELLIGENKYSSENCRKAYYIISPLLEILSEDEKNRIVEGIESEEELKSLIKSLEEAKIENEKMKIQFQDQRREYRKHIRESGRFDHLVSELTKSVEVLNKEKPLFNTHKQKIKILEDNEAILMTSDWHIGANFKNYFAEYSIDIAKKRIKELTEKTVEYCLANNVSTLHIELLGDSLDGSIHTSTRIESEEDVISELMIYCEVLSEMINELSIFIPYIKVHSVIGNHTRITPNKKESITKENFERLVPFYLKARLISVYNVEIVDSSVDDTIDVYEVKGQTIFCVHGDLDSPQNAVGKLSAMLKVFPDEVHMGHYHKHFEIDNYDMETVLNGSLKGTDNYAKEKRLSGSPMQKLMIYNEDGKLCTYKIKLK